MRKQLFLSLVCVMLFELNAWGQNNCGSLRYQDTIFHSVNVINGVYYASANPFGLSSSQDLYLDIYQPANDTVKHRPVLIFQHGGSFINGTRDMNVVPYYATYFAKCGYVVASIDYRLGFDPLSTGSSERAVYRSIQDLRAAVRFLCQHAELYGIDTNSVFLTGTSAGCISALCSAFITEQQYPSAIHGTLTESSDLGPIDSSGNTDFGNRYVKPRGVISHWGAILDTSYITTSDSIPVLCIQGTDDQVVPYEKGNPYGYPIFPVVYGSHPIGVRLSNLRVRSRLVPLLGYGHEPELDHPEIYDTMNNEGRLFLWRLLKPAKPSGWCPAEACKLGPAQYSVPAQHDAGYCWQLHNAGTIVNNTGNTITVLWSDTGNVSLSLIETNYMGATADSVTFRTHVPSTVKASFNYQHNGQQISFTNSSYKATSLLWYFGNGDSSDVANPTESYTTGNYQVTLIAADSVCGFADTTMQMVVIDSCPVAGFTQLADGLTVFFNADTTNTNLYTWNFGDGATATVNVNNVIHQYAHSGNYQVVLTVRNADGCANSDTISLALLGTGFENETEAGNIIKCNAGNDCVIEPGSSGYWNMELYDMLGRVVIVANKIGQEYVLQTGNLPPGIYLLKLDNNRQSMVQKFIKP